MAVLQVVVSHILLAMHHTMFGSIDVGWIGPAGVLIFFVHTSLVLMMSLERHPDTESFYVRRFFRLYPLAIAAILILLVFHIPTQHGPDGGPFFQFPPYKNILANLLLMQNMLGGGSILAVMWTLPLEIDMYILLPLLYFFVRRDYALWPIMLLWCVTVLYVRTSIVVRTDNNNYFLVFVPCFLSGVICYILFRRVKPRLPAFLMPTWVILLLGAFVFRPSYIKGWWLTIALGISPPLFRSIRSKWLVAGSKYVARYSYGIYLAHPFCIVIGVNLMQHYNIALRMAAILVSLAVIVVPAYHYLEKPMIDFGARLGDRIEARNNLLRESLLVAEEA
jgi:peptidoglycan/LPS O-acetylase OafA/YrhL